jgi:hypothetical protein
MSDLFTQIWHDALFVVLTAAVYALLEIQIEGPNGWAAKLPTWRKSGFPWNILVGADKELTGFHFYSTLLLLFLFHFPFLFVDWALSLELRVMALFFALRSIEDFLWFVLNPAYGISKFNRASIPWHKNWFLGLPTGYWIAVPGTAFLYWLSTRV